MMAKQQVKHVGLKVISGAAVGSAIYFKLKSSFQRYQKTDHGQSLHLCYVPPQRCWNSILVPVKPMDMVRIIRTRDRFCYVS